MKKVLLPAMLLGTLLLGCVLVAPYPTPTLEPTPAPTATPTAQPNPTEPPSLTGDIAVDWNDLTPYRQAMLPAYAGDVGRFAGATRYWIDLEVDVNRLSLSGVEQVRYTNHETESLAEIVFRLLPNTLGYGAAMAVQSVTVNGQVVRPELRFQDSALYVPLAQPLLPGESIELALTFVGTISTDRSVGYAQYGFIDGVLALPNAYPVIPVYDDEGWNVELAPPYGDATFTDTSLYLVRVTLPTGMVLATSGVTVERRDNGDGSVTYTCASGPMRDFCLVASADYDTQSAEVDQVRITSYYRPEHEEGGVRALDYAVHALRIYERTIGAYPFTELDVMATPTEAGGIEYPGLIVVAEWLYGQNGGFFELATVHEVAHQWWYSLVGNDQLDEPWLDEALTQYTSLLYYEYRYGQERAQSELENRFERPYQQLKENERDMPVGLPVAAYTEDLYGTVVYAKGPLFFHAVRQQTGDGAFIQILRTYFAQYRYGVAYPQDLMAVAERVSGQDLDPLYERWISGEQ